LQSAPPTDKGNITRVFEMVLRESEEFLATFDDVHEEILGKIKSILYFHD
jgi:hypothetical protein